MEVLDNMKHVEMICKIPENKKKVFDYIWQISYLLLAGLVS